MNYVDFTKITGKEVLELTSLVPFLPIVASLQSSYQSSFLTAHAGLTERPMVKGNEDPGY